jgi:hypothetical protein
VSLAHPPSPSFTALYGDGEPCSDVRPAPDPDRPARGPAPDRMPEALTPTPHTSLAGRAGRQAAERCRRKVRAGWIVREIHFRFWARKR